MKNRILYLLFIAFLACSLFISCEDNENDDKEAPKIEVIHVNDVFYLDATFLTKDSAVGDNKNLNLLKLRFTDNKALSSYIVSLIPDDSFVDPNKPIEMGNLMDSLAYTGVINSQLKDIFGMTNVYTEDNLYIKSIFQVADRETGKFNQYQTRPGKYILSIKCVDKANNEIFAETKKVWLLYPVEK